MSRQPILCGRIERSPDGGTWSQRPAEPVVRGGDRGCGRDEGGRRKDRDHRRAHRSGRVLPKRMRTAFALSGPACRAALVVSEPGGSPPPARPGSRHQEARPGHPHGGTGRGASRMSSRTRSRTSGISPHAVADPVLPEFDPAPQPRARLEPAGGRSATAVDESVAGLSSVIGPRDTARACRPAVVSDRPDRLALSADRADGAGVRDPLGAAPAGRCALLFPVARAVCRAMSTAMADGPVDTGSAPALGRAWIGSPGASCPAARPTPVITVGSPVYAAAVVPGPRGKAMNTVVSAVPISISSRRWATGACRRPGRSR